MLKLVLFLPYYCLEWVCCPDWYNMQNEMINKGNDNE